MKKNRKPRIADLDQFDSEWRLIPLHKPGSVSLRKGKKIRDGKRPLHSNWTKKKYPLNETVVKRWGRVNNIGVRLRKDQLIVDVDPRNGGMKGLKRLKKYLGTDLKQYPRVITGSGGFHYYMEKPKGLKILGSLEKLPGIDFKSVGGQVVAPGSVHPDTGKYYEWDAERPALSEGLPEAPRKLLKLIKRKEIPVDKNADDSTLLTPEQLEEMLSHISPEEYKDERQWRNMLMACHHGTSGDGREEFIEWSTSDPEYANDRGIIGRRWDSLSHKRPDGMVTVRTLYKALGERGMSHIIPDPEATAKAKSIFDGVEEADDEDGPAPELESKDMEPAKESSSACDEYNEETKGVLHEMNKKCCASNVKGKFRIFVQDWDSVLNRNGWLMFAKNDFESMYMNRTIESRGKEKKLGTAWLEWAYRHQKRAVVFRPLGAEDDELNLWTGWGVEPGDGDWSRLRRMIFEVLCNGEQARFDYVMNWCANMIQNPETPGQVALCVFGEKGVGKGTLGNALNSIAGQHGLHISGKDQFTGRFNSHLRDLLYLFADEALRASDKEAESRLKQLITEDTITFEGKGVDAVQGKNYMHVFIASNEKWIVPASHDERRYFVMEANKSWQGKKKRWKRLYHQLYKEGGINGFLTYLMQHKIPDDWDAQSNMPHTQELMEQKLRGMDKPLQFWYQVLEDGKLPFDNDAALGWENEGVTVFKEEMRLAYTDFCKENQFNRGAAGRSIDHFLFNELAAVLPGANNIMDLKVPRERRDGESDFLKMNPVTKKAKGIQIPSLPECVEAFNRHLRGK